LRATQSAISKQLKLLEEELGFDVFTRSGRTLTRVTSPGERVIRHALKMLREADNIHGLSEDLREDVRGSLSIGTTHTQARYVLPPIIQKFRLRYPNVQFHLQVCSAALLSVVPPDHRARGSSLDPDRASDAAGSGGLCDRDV
jgi:LysR family transcriptional regulator, cys regulon transcriptional activator